METGSGGDTAVVQLNSVTNYARYMVTHLVSSVCHEYPDHSLDVVILGCTHYPFVESRIRDHFTYLKQYRVEYDRLIAEDMVFIDPGKALAVELYRELAGSGLLGKGHRSDSRFFVSVPNPLLKENRLNERGEFPYSWKFGREANTLLQYVRIVPFSDQWIDAGIRARLREDIPTTYGIIYAD
jgi:glutamate racemase